MDAKLYVGAREKPKDDGLAATDNVSAGGKPKEWLLFKIERGHMHLRTSDGMTVFMFMAIMFLLYTAALSAGSKPNMARKLKLDPAFDVNAYVHRVNTTIGVLVKELQQVQAVLADMQKKHGKVAAV